MANGENYGNNIQTKSIVNVDPWASTEIFILRNEMSNNRPRAEVSGKVSQRSFPLITSKSVLLISFKTFKRNFQLFPRYSAIFFLRFQRKYRIQGILICNFNQLFLVI